jgi:hypothetical protein
MQDLFHFGRLAYPKEKDPSQYFWHALYTGAGSNPGKARAHIRVLPQDE